MFFRAKQDLKRLPSYKSPQGQRRHRWRGIVIVRDGLKSMLDAQGLPDVRYCPIGGIEEERIVVAAYGVIEGGKFPWIQLLVVRVANMVSLDVQ